jgi:ATP-dependent Clp protease protease subunit
MAAVLFAAGQQRDMLKHASVMIHDPLINSGIGGNALRIQSISEDLMRIREIMGNILAEHTGKPLEEIYEKTAKDTYFYAEEAVAYGLADKIIERL